ncbi:MAG TPA: NAD(P) transhydrogenase subunit alpha [Acidimicrobiales bacterium]|jgi:NAD(P) transhydrogenase subunit alpha|nr:NAD(P) transhydrogenase subunit alpha [Acidimicrobiales bacterium]
MKVSTVGVIAERPGGDRRVALVPDGVRRLLKTGLVVVVETGAGDAAFYPDASYQEAGAETVAHHDVLDRADIVLAVSRPPAADLSRLRAGQVLIGLLAPDADPAVFEGLGAQGVFAVSMERLPRTLSRGQVLDVLTSQASVAGYRAAIVAAAAYPRYFPMLITAAGTSRPARVLVLGAGVAGLSAIGTARRLGAVVTGYDVRPEAQGEVESLGARFLVLSAVGPAGGSGGYARALTADEQSAQQAELESRLGDFDIVITTAAVPGRRPPLLISSAGLAHMRPGSVVVDTAAGPLGGNVEGSAPGETRQAAPGVTVIGLDNASAGVPTAASDALSSNLCAVIGILLRDGELAIDPQDEVHAAIVVASPRPIGDPDARIPTV